MVRGPGDVVHKLAHNACPPMGPRDEILCVDEILSAILGFPNDGSAYIPRLDRN
jgi:hypothetical protein